MRSTRTVLVVEADGGELGPMLECERGFEVRTVDDPTDALDALDGVDCVVGGEGMIAPAGPPVIEAMHERRPSLPVVTVHGSGEAARRGYEAGVAVSVRRVEDATELAAELAAAVRRLTDRDDAARPSSGEDYLLEAAVETLTDVFFVFDLRGNFVHWNRRLHEATGYADETIAEMHPTDFVAPDHRERVADAIRRAVEEGTATVEADFLTAGGERLPFEFRGSLLTSRADDPVAVCGIGRNVAERRRRERTLERRTERLETLDRINAVIRDVNRALVRATRRSEIKQAVCDHLVGDSLYRFAWIGSEVVAGDGVEPDAWAGEGAEYLDERGGTADADDGVVTAATAVVEDRVIVAQRISADPEFETWRDAALDRGFESAAAIPLTYRDTVHGVLCLYASRPNAFDEIERGVLAELGETIGYALSAAEQRRALVTDTVVELEVSLPSGPFFVDAAVEAGTTVSVEGVTDSDDGEGLAEYQVVPTAAAERVLALADRRDAEATHVAKYGDRTLLSVGEPGRSIAAVVADHGGVLTDARADAEGGQVTVELPQDADVRAVVESIRETFPAADPRARRERERTGTRGMEFRDAFEGSLTDRQREVLEAAFLAGYFDWPRGSTAEEVADQLGVAAPTFHEHIRRIENKLLTAYFDALPPSAGLD